MQDDKAAEVELANLLQETERGSKRERERERERLSDSHTRTQGVDVQHDEAAGVELAKRLHESKPLVFRGVYSHSGNAYNAASKAEAKAICTLE